MPLLLHFTKQSQISHRSSPGWRGSGYHTSYGMDTVIPRGSNTYGPRQYPEKIIPLFIVNALQDKPLPVYGDGSAVRDYLHAEDHCTGIEVILHEGASGGAYNLGAR